MTINKIEYKDIDLNRYCNSCGSKLIVKDVIEPKRIGFDEFSGKDKLSHREYLGVCPKSKGIFTTHQTEWFCYDEYTHSYYYASLYNHRNNGMSIIQIFVLFAFAILPIIIIFSL